MEFITGNERSVSLRCEVLESRDVPAALTNLFDDSFYLRTNPDVAVAIQRGIFRAEDHFRLLGEVENRQGNPLFNANYYLQNNPDVAAAVQAGLIRSAFQHYEQFGQFENRPASGLFNGHDYFDDNPDVRGAVQAGVFAKASIETSQSLEIFETEPKDGINSGSFTAQGGVSYLLRVRAPDNVPAAYTVTLDLI